MCAASHASHHWSLGAVLAECSVDPQTYLLVVRADAGLGAALDLRRRMVRLGLVGYTTVLVDLEGAARLSDPMVAALMHGRRSLAAREGRLVVASEHATVRSALERAGLEVIDDLESE